MDARPKIKLDLSPLDHALEKTSVICLVLMWCLTFYTFFKLPPTIPIHFNGSGQADSYGNKFTLLILPILATLIYVGLTQLNKVPHIFNYMTKITMDNAHKQYTLATRMLRFLKLSILLIFTLIILFTYLAATGVTNGLGFWLLPLMLGLLLIPLLITMHQSFKNGIL